MLMTELEDHLPKKRGWGKDFLLFSSVHEAIVLIKLCRNNLRVQYALLGGMWKEKLLYTVNVWLTSPTFMIFYLYLIKTDTSLS